MQQIRKWICILPVMIACSVCFGQKTLTKAASVIFTADSVATGNYKDVLSSFFQLALNNLTGQKKEFKFTSNPFAVLARANPELMLDKNYLKYKNLRSLNFTFALNLDTSFKFNGFSSGVSYALINQRDITVSTEFVRRSYEGNAEYNRMNDSLNAFIARIADANERSKFRAAATAIFNDTSKVRFNKLSDTVQRLLKNLAVKVGATNFLTLVEKDPAVVVRDGSQKSFRELKELFQNKILWTVGVTDTTYKDNFMFSNIMLYTNFLKGILDPIKSFNIELDIKSFYNVVDDQLRPGRDLRRSLFVFEPGVNLVLKGRDTHQSFFECKLSGSYNRIFNGLGAGEKADRLLFNGILRVRVLGDIWVPLELKYDPKNGDVFGFLDIKLNFSTFKKMLDSFK